MHSKGDFADVIKLRIWGCGDDPELRRWGQRDHRGLYQGKREARGNDLRDVALLALKMEEGRHEPRNVGSLWKLEKARKWTSLPQSLQEKRSTVEMLILAW